MRITKEMIRVAGDKGACGSALDWLQREPRTVAELHIHYPLWADWASLRLLSRADQRIYAATVNMEKEVKALERGLRNAFPARKKR
jgi:hypothetical protein